MADRRARTACARSTDARELARRRLPEVVFDYIDGAAETERTMAANREAFESVGFVPEMAVPGRRRLPSLATTVLGTRGLPPRPARTGRLHPRDGTWRRPRQARRAAKAARTLFTMSSMSGHTMEQVPRPRAGPRGSSSTALGGRAGAEAARGARAGARVHRPRRHRRHAAPGEPRARPAPRRSLPLRLTRRDGGAVRAVGAAAPAMARGVLPRRLLDGPRARARPRRPGAPMSVDEAVVRWVLEPVSWDDFGWLREAFGGPVLAKGCCRRPTRAGRWTPARPASSSRTTAADSSTRCPPRSRRSATWSQRWAPRSRCCWTAGCGGGATWPRRSRSVRARCSSDGRGPTGSPPRANQASRASSTSSAPKLDRTMRLLGVDDVAKLGARHVSTPSAWPR